MDSRPHILVVDDETRAVELLVRSLRKLGRVATAGSAADAVALARRESFDLVVSEAGPIQAHAIENRQLMRETVSATFEGRDRFAPVAARLACGTPFEDVGPLVAMATRLAWPEPREEGRSVVGRVLAVDRFGNLITSFTRARWEPVVVGAAIRVGDAGPIPLVRTYGEAAPGALVALFGSTDYLELAVVGGSAAETLSAGVGTDVHVVRGA